jgi:nitrogen-specific signal transduction histidine kinase
VRSRPTDELPPGPPPYDALRARLVALADALDAKSPEAAAELRAVLEHWWADQLEWNGRIAASLGVHHEINNALVGVRGNAQLVMIGPAGQQPGVRERLEVVIRESERIQQAAARLRGLKSAFGSPDAPSRAA